MAGKGRKPKPTHLKVVAGTDKNHPERINRDAPTPAKSLPEPPDYLDTMAAEWFRKTTAILDGMGIASSDHVDMLALAALRFAEMVECMQIIEDVGRIYVVVDEGGNKRFKARPEVAMKNEAQRHFHGLLAEFGLSPSAVGKVHVDRAQADNEFGEFG